MRPAQRHMAAAADGGRNAPSPDGLLRLLRRRLALRLCGLRRPNVQQPTVQRGPHAALLLVEEGDGRQRDDALAEEQPQLLGVRGQVGLLWRLRMQDAARGQKHGVVELHRQRDDLAHHRRRGAPLLGLAQRSQRVRHPRRGLERPRDEGYAALPRGLPRQRRGGEQRPSRRNAFPLDILQESAELDLYCLDLDVWNWTQIEASSPLAPPGRFMHTVTLVAGQNLFVFGGLSFDGETLNDAWRFDTLAREWREVAHPHRDKPRVCHTACLGSDDDLVVFGGSSNLSIAMDTITMLRCASQTHTGDVLIVQTEPYPLLRLCEDFLGSNAQIFSPHLVRLPTKLRAKIDKRISFFSKSLLLT
ncbi:uncharacterized protein LOC133495787 isoform X2 [Syngnathoides biaculeatus]|uniref:uncharacterized protein LOC133495787 isoform X2 n=1 Tax=Syngnathoides biaculeatus TaxID=300417 RepID=UPI002ADD5BDB|nr:uncharacterized protein LOC133495787 isoform X2 [Syngnathoides biaculeatus]